MRYLRAVTTAVLDLVRELREPDVWETIYSQGTPVIQFMPTGKATLRRDYTIYTEHDGRAA